MKPIRYSLALRDGFGTDLHTQLCRAYALAGCYDHTPLATKLAMIDERIRANQSSDPRVMAVLKKARAIILLKAQ